MSILNSWMFKSSRSPPLSLQKQQFQFEREKQRKNKTPAASWLFFLPLGLARRDISDLSVLEVAQCAFISNQHGKQTLTDLFPFFHFCSCSVSLKLWENTLHKYITTSWRFVCSAAAFAHTHTHTRVCTREHKHSHIYSNKSAPKKKMPTIESCDRKLGDTVPFQFTDTTNGFLAAPWNQAAVMSMHQQWEEGEPSP